MAGKASDPQTMADALKAVLSSITDAMGTQDADVPFLMKLQGVVLARMKHPDQQGPASGQTPGSPAGGASPGTPAGGPTPPQAMPGGPQPSGAAPSAGQPLGGMNPNPPKPQVDPDEMRRLIAQTTGP